MSFEITGTLKLIDEASGAVERATDRINEALDKVENASKKVTFTQEEMTRGFKDAVVGLSGVATSAWGLYQAYDRLKEMQNRVQRANLAAERAAYQVTVAQEAYNKALEKYGANSEEAQQAAERLRLAQEQYNVATERAEILQGNLSEAMVQTGLMVIPSVITMVESLTKAKQAWAAAQMLLNNVLLANPIFLVIAAIGGLIAIVWTAYQHCEWFRDAVNKAGEMLYNFFKPAIDAVVGSVKWLVDAVGAAWNALVGFANAVGNAFNWLKETAGASVSAVTGDTDALAEKVEEGSAAASEAFASASRKMIVATETLEDYLPPIISDVFGGIKDAVLSMTGTTEAYYTAWKDESLRIVEENLEAQLREVEARYAEMTRKVDESLSAQLAEVEARYAEMTEKIDEELQNQLSEIAEHYEQLRAEENARYEESYDLLVAYYEHMFGLVETEQSRILELVNRHYDDEVRRVESSYDEQVNATMRFYDELLAANEEGLRQIREGRKRDLEDLELNMLLQKQALQQAYEAGLISTEEYNKKLQEIEKEYNEKRRAINDEYRLQELLALKEAREREEQIIAERNAKIEELERERTQAIHAINAERAEVLYEAKRREKLLEEQHQRNLANLEAEELAARNRLTEEAELQKATLIAEKEAEMQRLVEQAELEKTRLIAEKEAEMKSLIEAAEQEKARIIDEYGAKMQAASQSWWSGIADAIRGACESAGRALYGFVESVCSAMGEAWNAISSFISKICFAHAIHEAVVSSIKDLAEWNRAVEDAMESGVESVSSFVSDMAKPVLAVTTAERPAIGRGVGVYAPSPEASRVELHFLAPLVHVEGSADRRTAELAAELIERRLRSVIVEASSSGAPGTHKRIRMEKAVAI